MSIDDGDAVFDRVRDLSNGEGRPSFGDDHFPGRIQYTGLYFAFLPYFTIADPHFLPMLLFITLLAKLDHFSIPPNFFAYFERRPPRDIPIALRYLRYMRHRCAMRCWRCMRHMHCEINGRKYPSNYPALCPPSGDGRDRSLPGPVC